MSALTTPLHETLVDKLDRPMRALRISLTDRCNLRCRYCMPEDHYDWLPKSEHLSQDAIIRLVSAFQQLGVSKLRLTGGEPLLRKDAVAIVAALRENFPDLEIAMTTNATLLGPVARDLKLAGLDRLTISLDAANQKQFEAVTRRAQFNSAAEGLRAAAEAGFEALKINAVLLKETLQDASSLIRLAAENNAELRFIEYMDVGGATQWSTDSFINGDTFRGYLTEQFGTFQELKRVRGETAQRFRLLNGQVLGFIESMSQPFCQQCDRSRITADGIWFHCLYAQNGVNLIPWLSKPTHELENQISAAWKQRSDQGAYERKISGKQGPLYSLEELRIQPHLEMHTRGG